MLACLVTLSPLLSGSDRRVTINLCSVADRRVTALGGIRWEPAITQAPALGMQFWNGDFEQGTDAGKVDLTFNLAQALKAYPDVINAVWMGAEVEVALGVVGKAWPWMTRFKGRVTSYAGGEYPAMKISASVDTEPFNVDVLNRTYAGTTGAEGGADLKEKVKPMALGRPRNVEPVLINAVDSVYQFSAYGPIEAVEVLYERASAFPASSGNYATYAALVAADLDPGRWATCLAEGLIRLGAPAYGVITGDIRGHAVGGVAPRGAGALIQVMAGICGIPAGLIATARLQDLDGEGATYSDVMVTEQVKFLEAARRLILPCNWQVVVSNLGIMLAMKPAFSSVEVMTLHAQGRREPLVSTTTEEAVSVPYKKTVMAAERCWRVHSFDEIATSAPLVDRGDYDAAAVYREGNIVSMPDGSRWEFISTTPQAGVTPGTNPAVWAFMSGPLAASFYAQLSNESHTVAAASDGTVLSFADAGGLFAVTDPAGAVVPGFTFTVESETGVDVSIDPATGVYAVASMSADSGTAVLRATKGTIIFERVYSIAKAIAGQSALAVSALPPTVTVPSTANGTPKAAIPGFTVSCTLGGVDITSTAITGFTSNGLTGVSRSGGVFTVTGMTADTGYVEVAFAYGGSSTTLQVPYTKSKDGAAFVTTSNSVVSPAATTYGQVAYASLLMGPNGNITVDANGAFWKSGAGGSINVDGYFEYSLNGGSSWAVLPGTFSSSAAISGGEGSFNASGAVSGASIGLASAQTVSVQLMMRKSNTNSFDTFDGTMAVQWVGS